jgi:multisubunit Na+/H+ antiporter MnhB subunit
MSSDRDRSTGERALSATMWSVYGIHSLIHFTNVLGFPFEPSFGAYYLASIVILALGVSQFLIVAFQQLKPAA